MCKQVREVAQVLEEQGLTDEAAAEDIAVVFLSPSQIFNCLLTSIKHSLYFNRRKHMQTLGTLMAGFGLIAALMGSLMYQETSVAQPLPMMTYPLMIVGGVCVVGGITLSIVGRARKPSHPTW